MHGDTGYFPTLVEDSESVAEMRLKAGSVLSTSHRADSVCYGSSSIALDSNTTMIVRGCVLHVTAAKCSTLALAEPNAHTGRG